MYQHGTNFSLNNKCCFTWFGHERYNILIQLLKYILFYNVHILIVKSFIYSKIRVAHHFKKVSVFTGQNSHTRLVFENTVTRTWKFVI